MKIYITGLPSGYEVEHLVRLFYPMAPLTLTPPEEGEDCVWAEKKEDSLYAMVREQGQSRDAAAPLPRPVEAGGETVEFTLASLTYDLLRSWTGIRPPWGKMTGVRPVRLIHDKRAAGWTEADIDRFFLERFDCSRQKYDMAKAIADLQEPILKLGSAPKTYSLYLGIPFCPSRCSYCSFVSCNLDRDRKLVQPYVDCLCREVEAIREQADKAGLKLCSIYIGGGTPSVLTSEQLCRILGAVYSHFEVEDGAEITVEMNPENVTEELVCSLVRNGVGRVSMGVQSFCDGELALLGRRGSADICEKAFDTLRQCSVRNISLDLMLAIPSQTEETLAYTLKKMLALSPEHISAYLLKIEKNTVFGKCGVEEADEEIQRRLYLQTCRTLENAGYEHYEVSNFAKKGFRSVHNSSYWQCVPYLCFGCGASGFDGKIRYKFPESLEAFTGRNGLVEPETEEILDDEDLRRERIMLSLRTSDGVSFNDLNAEQRRFLKSLEASGLTKETVTGFRLTDDGFLVSNTIIVKLSEFE